MILPSGFAEQYNIIKRSLFVQRNHMTVYNYEQNIKSQNKITDFLMILAWASPFNLVWSVFITII